MGDPQPADEWDYLRPDGDDDDPEAHRDPEELALHLEDPDASPVHDPGRADVGVGAADEGRRPAAHYADEEPEGPARPTAVDHEPDLEEILESQHYAFADEHEAADER